jgi:hypothetical protein
MLWFWKRLAAGLLGGRLFLNGKFLTNFCTFLFLLFAPFSLHAALPFVTDDAGIADPNQLLIESFSEVWNLPRKGNNSAATLSGNYVGLSYGTNKNLEIAVGGLAAYDFSANSGSFMNPILQLKTVAFKPQKTSALPQIALSAGYVNKNGQGQYFDPASNTYLLAIATKKFFDEWLIMHVNIGSKASFDLGKNHKRIYRNQLGVAADIGLLRKDFRLIVESFNGAPNSPRDSAGYFHSYQVGFRFLKSDTLAFHILYGNQPTFMGYENDSNTLLYRRSNWIQIGIRKAINDIF